LEAKGQVHASTYNFPVATVHTAVSSVNTSWQSLLLH